MSVCLLLPSDIGASGSQAFWRRDLNQHLSCSQVFWPWTEFYRWCSCFSACRWQIVGLQVSITMWVTSYNVSSYVYLYTSYWRILIHTPWLSMFSQLNLWLFKFLSWQCLFLLRETDCLFNQRRSNSQNDCQKLLFFFFLQWNLSIYNSFLNYWLNYMAWLYFGGLQNHYRWWFQPWN